MSWGLGVIPMTFNTDQIFFVFMSVTEQQQHKKSIMFFLVMLNI